MQKRNHRSQQSEDAWSKELAIARARWGAKLSPVLEEQLASIIGRTGLRVSANEVQLIDFNLYVNHAGLLRIARLKRCAGIETEVLEGASDPSRNQWVVRAKVFKSARCKTTFAGLGDATPENIDVKLRGSELRVAETRAVNRALRKAYSVSLCSTEELRARSEYDLSLESCSKASSHFAAAEVATLKTLPDSCAQISSPVPSSVDRLKLLIREHTLEPGKVRQYACRYLNVEDLRQATQDQVAKLITHLEQFATASPTWFRSELDRAEANVQQSGTSGPSAEVPEGYYDRGQKERLQ